MEWFGLIEQVLYVVVSVAMYFIIKFLKDRGIIEKAKQIQINDDIKNHAAKLSVLFAQQVYHEHGGKVKYEQAVNYLSKYLTDRGISISDAEIKLLIEANLIRAKDELSKVWTEK